MRLPRLNVLIDPSRPLVRYERTFDHLLAALTNDDQTNGLISLVRIDETLHAIDVIDLPAPHCNHHVTRHKAKRGIVVHVDDQ